ncbi:MAG: hypothetical protein IPK05_19710 [Comamonadaceae bacterium]|nr:hypothetical protein [Comamonadaceae bacterium]
MLRACLSSGSLPQIWHRCVDEIRILLHFMDAPSGELGEVNALLDEWRRQRRRRTYSGTGGRW